MSGSNVVTYDGCIKDLNALVALDMGNWRVGLYTNNHVPTQADVPSDYTPPTFTGYSMLAIAGWNPATLFTPPDVHNSATAYLTWQPTAMTSLPQTVYGVYLTDGAMTPDLLAAEYFDTPFTFVDTGSILRYLPRFFAGLLPP